MYLSRTGIMQLKTPVDQVFPLFGPVEETKWAHDWEPFDIIPEGAVFMKGMCFKTRSTNPHEDCFLWELTRLSHKKTEVQYTVKTTNRTWNIEICCKRTGLRSTRVKVTYIYRALNDVGTPLNRQALQDIFKQDLQDWETAINFYLETGSCYEPVQDRGVD